MLTHAALPHQHYPPLLPPATPAVSLAILTISAHGLNLRLRSEHPISRLSLTCSVRRRVRYEEDEDPESYEHNPEIAMLESYTESARSEALLVRASIDDEEETVLIFKGFSSCLSSRTASDPSKSVLPMRAVIQSVDVIKGPFDPTEIEFLERGLTWDVFKTRIQSEGL